MGKWKDYIQRTKDDPPYEHLVNALPLINDKNIALEIGAGALNDTKELLRFGFKHIDIVEIEPYVKELAKKLKNVTVHITSVQKFDFPTNHYDLISAMYVLHFINPQHLSRVLRDMYKSLKPGGVMIGNLMGNRHGWLKDKRGRRGRFYSIQDTEELLFPIGGSITVSEREYIGMKDTKETFWHTIEFVVTKPS